MEVIHQRVAMAGVTLASILHHVVVTPSDAEGLVLGNVVHRVVPIVDDLKGDVNVKEITLDVQEIVWTGTSMSFYGVDGEVNEAVLHQWVEGRDKTLLGFVRTRGNSALRPSLREKAVFEALQRVSSSSSPVLFALFSTSTATSQAHHTFDYQFFCGESIDVTDAEGTPSHHIRMIPLSVEIQNLGASCAAEYTRFKPSSPFHAHVDTFAPVITAMGSDTWKRLTDLEQPHVTEVRRLVETMLQELAKLEKDVTQGDAEIQKKREERRRLLSS